jgi:hypothetical protein
VARRTEELQAEIRGHFFLGYSAKREYHSLCAGQPLILIREPHNHYDRNAILVASLCGVRCGYVAREVAARVAPEIDAGARWLAKVYSEATKKKKAMALLWKEEGDGEENFTNHREKETT